MITIKQFDLKDVDYIMRLFSNPKNREFQKTKRIDRDKALKLITSTKVKIVYGVFLEDELIGYAMLKDFPNNAKIGISLDEQFWGHGYGLETMKLLEEEARKNNCKRISLLVDERNERALNLYKKLNYQDTKLKLLEKDLSN